MCVQLPEEEVVPGNVPSGSEETGLFRQKNLVLSALPPEPLRAKEPNSKEMDFVVVVFLTSPIWALRGQNFILSSAMKKQCWTSAITDFMVLILASRLCFAHDVKMWVIRRDDSGLDILMCSHEENPASLSVDTYDHVIFFFNNSKFVWFCLLYYFYQQLYQSKWIYSGFYTIKSHVVKEVQLGGSAGVEENEYE